MRMCEGAELSEDRVYRFSLTRQIDDRDDTAMMFIMLNPSTADETTDDPTIRRCMGFAHRWGYSWMHVTNLFPFRATSPKELHVRAYDHDIQRQNLARIAHIGLTASIIVAAWGNHGALHGEGHRVLKALINSPSYRINDYDSEFIDLNSSSPISFGSPFNMYHLGLTKHGQPKHPLYLPYDAPLTPYGTTYGGTDE